MADGGEMDEEAMRAFFPLSFGKAPARPSSASSSAAHSSTLRKPQNPSNPKPSASTAADEDGGAMIGPPRPPSAPAGEDDDEDGGSGMIGPPRPPPPSAHGEGEDDEGGGMIGPPRPPLADENDNEDDEDDDDMEDDGDIGFSRIPLSNEIVLRGHTKVVSALAVDHTGSRVLSGSYDYTVRMYDFQGMNSKLQSFRQLEPFEGHQVRSLSWSPTSDRFLCVTGSAQAKIYDRDGLTLGEFVKGDMYIRDLKNTKGHISGLTGGEWNPKSKETILTSSEDGSIRLWDVSDFKSQKQVIKPKLVRPMRIPVTSCAWDHEGKRIVGGIGDGSIQLWTIKTGWGSRPDIHVEKTHTEDITGVKFSTDGQILLSRSMDSTLKIWDLRRMKTPLKVFEDLPNNYAETNAAFSPDEQLIFTGTSIEKDGDNGGLLCFFDRKKLELVSRVGISPHYSVIRCLWHPRINQVFATVGDKKEGGTHILFDPSISQRGALVCVGRAPRKKSVDDFELQPVIHNPHALPLFRRLPPPPFLGFPPAPHPRPPAASSRGGVGETRPPAPLLLGLAAPRRPLLREQAMAGQTGNPANHHISPHVIGGAFVQQYYHILHEQPDQVHKFYQESSTLGRTDSNGTMVYVTTLGNINEKIMSMDFRNCLTEIETADAQLSHKDGVLIVVTGSLTSDEGVCRRFTQSFFLAPQESGGYFVLNDVFRFISERKPAEINQVVTQEIESSQNDRSASESCSALPEPTPVDRSVISDHETTENIVTERQVSNPPVNGAVENNVHAEPPVQVDKEDLKKAPVAAPPPPAPTQTNVTRKSYASIVKDVKEGPPTPQVAKTTPSVAKQKPAPKPVSKAVEGPEKSSVKPTQANETSDGIVAQNNYSRNEPGYSIFVKNLPFSANIEIVEEEFKKFGTIKPGGVQVRHNKDDRFVYGFVQYESQQSMQSAIEASPILMEEKEVYIEAKRVNSRGGRFQSGRGVYHGDNFRGRGGSYVDNANYRGGDNFNRRNEGEGYNRRNDGDFYNRRNNGEIYRRNDGENYNRRNDEESYIRRNDGENYNRRNDGDNYNRRNDGDNYNRRNERSDGDNYNRRNDGENFNRRNDGENFNRRNDGENYNRRNDGENYNRRNDGGENFNRRNNFRNHNEFSGRGQGPPPPGNGYHQNGNDHPARPFQNGNGRFGRVNSGPKQSPVAA